MRLPRVFQIGCVLLAMAGLTLSTAAVAQTAVAQTAVAQTTGKAGQKPPPKAAAKEPESTRPTDYTSPHFLLHTDLPPSQAKELLGRLETMLGLISKYWGKPCTGIIECFVVKDLKNWPEGTLDPDGRAKVEEGAGVTLGSIRTLGDQFQAKGVVYAVADHGTPQHEAVHAYCTQTFGTTGPTWYSEGMAEMGQYWKAGDLAVNIHPGVLEYLQESSPKGLLEIVDTKQRTGDSWQNYAWRWALCHLLANNTNYMQRFHPLGMGLLTKQKDASFEQVYGAMAEEISFEYLFFLEHLDNGYRVDLCSWDWKKKFRPLQTSVIVSTTVEAGRGWQASGLTVTADQEFEYSATGAWQTSKEDKAVDAEGGEAGRGKLVGILLKDFKLGEPFELGRFGSFKAPADGNLYLRCQDKWNEIADNKGKLSLKFKVKGKGEPLPEPKDK